MIWARSSKEAWIIRFCRRNDHKISARVWWGSYTTQLDTLRYEKIVYNWSVKTVPDKQSTRGFGLPAILKIIIDHWEIKEERIYFTSWKCKNQTRHTSVPSNVRLFFEVLPKADENSTTQENENVLRPTNCCKKFVAFIDSSWKLVLGKDITSCELKPRTN